MLTVSVTIKADIFKTWDYFTKPIHIINWYFASPDWHCPYATNDLIENGKFDFRMEAKDNSFGFDFEGTYSKVLLHKEINYSLVDERKVFVTFTQKENTVKIMETFDPEIENSLELQEAGWKAILNNFKNYVEHT